MFFVIARRGKSCGRDRHRAKASIQSESPFFDLGITARAIETPLSRNVITSNHVGNLLNCGSGTLHRCPPTQQPWDNRNLRTFTQSSFSLGMTISGRGSADGILFFVGSLQFGEREVGTCTHRM